MVDVHYASSNNPVAFLYKIVVFKFSSHDVLFSKPTFSISSPSSSSDMCGQVHGPFGPTGLVFTGLVPIADGNVTSVENMGKTSPLIFTQAGGRGEGEGEENETDYLKMIWRNSYIYANTGNNRIYIVQRRRLTSTRRK